jgi:hypothetical protein
MKSLTFFTAVAAGRGNAYGEAGGRADSALIAIDSEQPSVYNGERGHGGEEGDCVKDELVMLSTFCGAAQGRSAARGTNIIAMGAEASELKITWRAACKQQAFYQSVDCPWLKYTERR